MANESARTSVRLPKPEYKTEDEKDEGEGKIVLTAEQQAALYFARKRRRNAQP